MYSFLDAKLLAKNLRHSLLKAGIERSHGECLELVSHQFGLKDWNQLSARIAVTLAQMAGDNPPLPDGWKITRQTDRAVYSIGIDPLESGTVRLGCRFGRDDGMVLQPDSFAALMQSISAARYRGRKVAIDAMIATEDADAASIWMRVDQALGQVLRFDNMLDRSSEGALRGTNDWSRRRIVLDVPEQAASLHYGLLLQGFGQMRVRKLTISAVAPELPVTAGAGKLPEQPVNLGFEAAG